LLVARALAPAKRATPISDLAPAKRCEGINPGREPQVNSDINSAAREAGDRAKSVTCIRSDTRDDLKIGLPWP
jgi:hypothetical protein